MRDEIAPKNIMMIGPTGVGKTEIARRLAQLARRAVRQGRGLEVHRGRLRRARRRLDGARPGRDRRVDAARRGARARAPARPRERRGAAARRAAAAAAAPRRRRSRRRPGAPSRQPAPPPDEAAPPADNATREKLRELLRDGKLDDRDGRDRHRRRAAVVHRRVLRHRAWRRWCCNLQDMMPQRRPRARSGGALHGARGARAADRRGGRQADRHGAGCTKRGGPARRAGRASSSSTRSTRSPAARAAAATAPTSRARACSATCCRSSRARP